MSTIFCGNGKKEWTEQCDGNDGVGPNQVCSAQCTLNNKPPVCGDGIRNNNEQCDYNDASRNWFGKDGCSQLCQPINNPLCGNGIKEWNEQCDDGNTNNNDGCNNSCQPNPNYCPTLNKNKWDVCDDNDFATKNDVVTGECICKWIPKTKCGDGMIQNPNDYGQTEQCDDGNTNDNDKCSNSCKIQLKLGDYVWLDANENGLQDTNEVPVPNVPVKLYNGCGVNGTPKTMTTNNDGKYLFEKLQPGQYTVMFDINKKFYLFTKQEQGNNRAIDSNPDPITGITKCITLNDDDLTIDAGVILEQPVSCESLTIDRTSAWPSTVINYECKHQWAKTVSVTIVQSGTNNVIATSNQFKGTLTLPSSVVGWDYIVRCTLDGGIDYKVSVYQAYSGATVLYRVNKNDATMKCAIPTVFDPSKRIPLDLKSVLTWAKPVPICTQNQMMSNDYKNVNASPNESLLIRDDTACKIPLKVVQWAQLGDRLWHDVNRNGLQDNAEPGIGGSRVELYACDGTSLLAAQSTAGDGLYLFTNLNTGSYRVKFALPGWYNAFTVKWAWADPRLDSNVNPSTSFTDCITLGANESNITIDAWVFKSDTPWCTVNCGWGNYNFCGDGKVNTSSEQCDDGNTINGDGCSSSCRIDTCTGNNCGGINTGANIIGILCESIDPPSVNVGEYLPFRWTMETPDSKVKFVNNCGQAEDGKTNIIKSDSVDDPICHFAMRNGKGEVVEFSRYCFGKQDLQQYPLFNSFLDTRPVTLKHYLSAYTDPLKWGTSFIGPANWKEREDRKQLSVLGEYALGLTKTTFKTCNKVTTAVNNTSTSSTYVVSPTRYISVNKAGFGRECSFNFTVTKPYFVQQGQSLATRSVDEQTIKSFYGFTSNTAGQIIANITQFNNYNVSQNLDYLVWQFVNKYSQLATAEAGNFSKVPNKEIYIYRGTTKLTILNGMQIQGTLISLNADIDIKGNLAGIAMIIAPNNTIDFQATSQQYDEVQKIEGIYIAKKITTSTKISNDYLGNAKRASKWWVTLKGLMISANATKDINNLVDQRRSHLNTWFNVDKPNNGQNEKKLSILKWAAFIIETDPSFWLDLPPGANELMTALDTYRK